MTTPASPGSSDPRDTGTFTHTPTRREKLRPAELVGISGAMGLFVGFIVLVTTHEALFAVIAFGIAFIVALVCIALFMLSLKPDAFESSDIHAQDQDQ